MPEMPRGRGIRRGRGRCQIGQQAGWVVSGIAVSSSPRRLWLQCLTLCRIRLRPQGPARRQKTRLRFEQREVLRKNQTRVGSPPGSANGTLRRKQRRGQGQRLKAQGAGLWGGRLGGGTGCWGAGCPGQWPWENVATLAPREPARPCRQSAVRTTQLQRPTQAKKVLSAQC